jgi:LL-diaminopimelate aminotransferase
MYKSVVLNKNFEKLDKNYLFTEISRRVAEYKDKHPSAEIISLGIGDVTQPLAPCVVRALKRAAAEMGMAETFRGYPPENGYPFLKNAVIKHYERLGVALNADEIFISDGAKSDLGGLTDIFGANKVIITDPVYPAYLDGNIIAGRRAEFLPAAEKNGFLPMPTDCTLPLNILHKTHKNRPAAAAEQGAVVKFPDAPLPPFRPRQGTVIYLCSPNNPTGSVYNRQQLTEWVQFAQATGSVIIFDAAYSAWLPPNTHPRSIFEIAGAESAAVEVNSLSKSHGFTNLRCSWTIIKDKKLNALWKRRQSAKFNGVSYIVQRAGEAALSPAGQKQCVEQVAYYKANAVRLTEFLESVGAVFYGGRHSPYIWLKCPNGMGSWEFFDKMLNECQIAVTPGAGFGACGEGFVRLSSFASAENVTKAIERLRRFMLPLTVKPD